MGLQKEIWIQDIIKALFPDHSFMMKAVNHDQYVLAGKVVHVPNENQLPAVERNRSYIPAAVVQLADQDLTYALDEYTTDPVYIPNAETIELSYDKRQSVFGRHTKQLETLVAKWMAYAWAATDAAHILKTTGTVTSGKRELQPKDLFAAAELLDGEDIPAEGRIALVPSKLYWQLFTHDEVKRADAYGSPNLPKGVLMEFAGFQIMKRSSTTIYDFNGGSPLAKAPSAAAGGADHQAVQIWHEDAVSRAKGEIKMFEDTDSPTYYGDIYSALVRAGGRKLRNDNKGVVAIVEGT